LTLIVACIANEVLYAQPAVGRWKRVTSPHGRFSIEVPEGWAMQPKDPYERWVFVAPGGRDFPSVGILGWFTAWDFQYMRTRQDDFRLLCRQVSVQDLYGQILQPLLRQSSPDLRIERMLPTHPSPRARVEGALTYQAQLSRFLDVVSMEYLADPSEVRCRQAWHSFAFIGSLIAPSKDHPGLLPAAERVWSSFTPTSRWGAEEREETLRGIQTRLARIGQTLNNVARMEMNKRMQDMQSSRRLSQGWIDTFGGVYRYMDPKDRSYEGTIPGSQIPSGPTRWWRCGNRPPVASDRSPGYGCYQVPAP